MAVALRVRGIGFGPGVAFARVDESGVLELMEQIDRSGLFMPLALFWGGGYLYPLYAFVKLWGRVAWRRPLVVQLARDPFPVRLVGRYFSVLCSTAAVPLVYLLGRRLGGRGAGSLSALLIAVVPLAVREAHFAKADSTAMLVGVVVLLACTAEWSSARRRVLGLGAVLGLAGATKILIGFAPAVVLALIADERRWRDAARSVGVAGVIAAAVYLVLDPVWVLGLHDTLSIVPLFHVGLQARETVQYLDQAGYGNPIHYHAAISVRYGCGLAIAVLTLPALVYGLAAGRAQRLVAVGVLGHWATLAMYRLSVARHLLPSVPGVLVLVACLVTEVVSHLRRTRGVWPARIAATAATVLLVAGPLATSVTLGRLLAVPDTRVLAGDWIAAHLPPSARVVSWGTPGSLLMDCGRPPLGAREVFQGLAPERWSAYGATHVVVHSYPLPHSSVALPAAIAARLEPLVVFDPFDGPLDHPVLEPLDAFYLPLAGFSGIARPGPRIEIYAIPAGDGAAGP